MEARQTVCGLEISVWALSSVDSREHTAIITAEMENRNAVWLTVTSGVTRQRSSQKETSTMAGRRELLFSPNTAQSAGAADAQQGDASGSDAGGAPGGAQLFP